MYQKHKVDEKTTFKITPDETGAPECAVIDEADIEGNVVLAVRSADSGAPAVCDHPIKYTLAGASGKDDASEKSPCRAQCNSEGGA